MSDKKKKLSDKGSNDTSFVMNDCIGRRGGKYTIKSLLEMTERKNWKPKTADKKTKDDLCRFVHKMIGNNSSPKRSESRSPSKTPRSRSKSPSRSHKNAEDEIKREREKEKEINRKKAHSKSGSPKTQKSKKEHRVDEAELIKEIADFIEANKHSKNLKQQVTGRFTLLNIFTKKELEKIVDKIQKHEPIKISSKKKSPSDSSKKKSPSDSSKKKSGKFNIDNCVGKKGGDYTIKSLLALAKEHGWKPTTADKKTKDDLCRFVARKSK